MRRLVFLAWLGGCGGSVVDTEVPVEPIGPIMELSKTEVAFGDRPIGRSAPPIEVTIRNVGDEPLDVYALWTDSDTFGVESLGESFRVRAGSEGSFIVTFRPEAPGPHRTDVFIDSTYNRGGGAKRLPVTGFGVAGDLVVEPPALEVGVAPVAITLANDGASTLRLTGADVEGDPGFVLDLLPGTNGSLPMDLEPRDPVSRRPFRTVELRFDPARSDGTRLGTLVLRSDDWDTPKLDVPLSVIEGG